MGLVDAHAHLQADAFATDLESVLQAAAAAGVEEILVPGWDLPSSRAAVALAHRWTGESSLPRLHAAVGVHPHAAAAADEAAWVEVIDAAEDPAVVAIGETGLDYDRMFSPRESQLASLRRHLKLAFESARPAILHCRSAPGSRAAQDDLLAELRRAGVGGPQWSGRFGTRPPAVLHSFSGPLDYAEAALGLGLAISFSALVFRRGEGASAEAARLVPASRLLVETDSPYLSPPGRSRRRNEPSWVADVAAWLADQRGQGLSEVTAAVRGSFSQLIGRAPAGPVR